MKNFSKQYFKHAALHFASLQNYDLQSLKPVKKSAVLRIRIRIQVFFIRIRIQVFFIRIRIRIRILKTTKNILISILFFLIFSIDLNTVLDKL